MTIETLREDIHRCRDELPKSALPAEIQAYFKSTLYPLLDAFMDEVDEIDESVYDLVSKSEDILQPVTAGKIIILVQLFLTTIKELTSRLDRKSPKDKALAVELAKYVAMCKDTRNLIAQITVTHQEEDEDEDDEAPAPLVSVPASETPDAVEDADVPGSP